MAVTAGQLSADLDAAFSDWGESITYRQVSATYDPQTQQTSESFTDTAVTAIVSGVEADPTPGTAAQNLSNAINFLVRVSELPAGEPKLTSKVVYGGVQYVVVGYINSSDGLTSQLECRKV